MTLSDYLEHILSLLEDAGFQALPLDSRMTEPAEPGLYYSARWDREFLFAGDAEHGLLALELVAVDSCLSDAVAMARDARNALLEGLGMRITEARVSSLSEGERARATLSLRCYF